jgi:hypothetical protein
VRGARDIVKRMKIQPLPPTMVSEVVALWRAAGLTRRPWNDPLDDLQRAMASATSTVLVGIAGGVLISTAMIGRTATVDGCTTWR